MSLFYIYVHNTCIAPLYVCIYVIRVELMDLLLTNRCAGQTRKAFAKQTFLSPLLQFLSPLLYFISSFEIYLQSVS